MLLHETQNPHELAEVFTLRRSQLVLLKERDDDVPQISEPLHAVQGQLLPVVIVPLIHIHPAASEDADKLFQMHHDPTPTVQPQIVAVPASEVPLCDF